MRWLVMVCGLALACSGGAANQPGSTAQQADAAALASIRAVHGGAGPWVVAGFRMGRYALARLGLRQGSFDLEVVHHTPGEVQYACIADGAAAATGVSLGRLNLRLQAAAAAETRTTYRRRSNGAELTLQVAPEFASRYTNVPPSQLAAAGREVLQLPDAAIFIEASSGQQ
ncbi:MAG: FmdE family protein [Polyangiales bacterium]